MLDAMRTVMLKEFPTALHRRLEPGLAAYDIRFCGPSDWPALREFLREHWSASHPYVTNPAFERWQQFDPVTGRHNYALAEHRGSGAIHGMQAFLSPSHFDPAIPACDLWPGLWCAAPGAAPGLGSEITRFLVRELRARSVGSLGLSRNTQTILPRLGYTMGVMDRHVLLNPDIRDFRLVGEAGRASKPVAESELPRGEMRELGPEEVEAYAAASIDFHATVPQKSPVYLRNRYARHPWYRYRFHAMRSPDSGAGLIVTRTAEADGARAVRVVSFVGDESAWAGAGAGLRRLVREENAEFLDVLSCGIDTGLFGRAGLAPHRAADPLVLPHYFEPLERRNKDLAYGFIVPPGIRYRMFKGDSDQDRPNLIPPTLRNAG
jgi:hypothetical protein